MPSLTLDRVLCGMLALVVVLRVAMYYGDRE